jgi:4-amino-4-deoxy-L-arabinose transferase-like glycosyltransferase
MELIRRYLTSRKGSPGRDLALLLVGFVPVFFGLLGRLPLMEPDEGRYAEIPREMIQLGDFITPHLNYVKYFEKPPLLYWMNALSFSLFGQNEFAARFFCALCGLLTVLLTYHAGRILFDRRAGILAALVLGTSAGFVGQSRIILTDIPLTLCLTATFLFFLLASRENGRNRGLYWHLFYLAAALSVLAKGLIGIVLPGGVVFVYILATGRWRLLREMRLLTGIPLFLLVCAPWFIAVSLKNPEFPHFFFIREHFQRFTSKIHHRYKPVWFFVPVLLTCLLPWTLFLPSTLRRIWHERRADGADARLYLIIWAGVVFAFFSVSSSKLIPYVLPVFPALALLVGERLAAALDGDDRWLRGTGFALAALLIPAGAGVVLYPHLARNPGLSLVAATTLGTILVVQGATAVAASRRRDAARLVAGLSAGAWLFCLVGPPLVFTTVIERKTSKDLALIARTELPGTVIANYSNYDQGLAFYTGRRVVQVGELGELEFGSQQGDQSAWFMSEERFRPVWNSPTRVVILVKKQNRDQFTRLMGSTGRVMAENSQKVLITNQP